jgi:hypothetical protein
MTVPAPHPDPESRDIQIKSHQGVGMQRLQYLQIETA